MRLLYNPEHPKHRDLMHQNYGLRLADLYMKPGPSVSFISRIFSLQLLLALSAVMACIALHSTV